MTEHETPTQRAHQAHPQLPSAKWKAHRDAIESHATRTAAERAEQDRERHDATEYHRQSEPRPGGG